MLGKSQGPSPLESAAAEAAGREKIASQQTFLSEETERLFRLFGARSALTPNRSGGSVLGSMGNPYRVQGF